VATQRITVTKIGGAAADEILPKLREWSAARAAADRNASAREQWPPEVRRQADGLADHLRANSFASPVVYFAEWVDMWSMGDLFSQWLTPPDGPVPFAIHADRFEVFGYGLPDGDRLARHLAGAGPQQLAEQDWYVRRLREAVEAWQKLVERAVLVVLRQVMEGSVTDEEIRVSLEHVPEWLAAGQGVD
jgi:hypothetical protein